MRITERRIEIYTSILLAATSLLTAWCAYQASAWASNQATAAQAAGRLRTEANAAYIRGGQFNIVDVTTYADWVNAFYKKDFALADFYRERFTPDFAPAFEAWLATDPLQNSNAPKTPFAMPEYQQSSYVKAVELEKQADEQSDAFATANALSTAYVRNTLLFATTLFLCSMIGRIEVRGAKMALLAMATLIMLAGATNAVMMARAW